MDISIKQEKWRQERPLFEAEFIHSHLLPYFNFNESTGDYEIKSEFSEDKDLKLAYEVLNTGWAMWLRAKRDAKSQADAPGHITVTHERFQELIAIAVKAALDEREQK
ncbi:hypothetical protein [Acinetobacter towneri]|uniref:hypothetical protein n=1 Tax=Acinetobacter towneri TaxID=202956 RepID=UPI002096C4DB|nr:hypothetical protein [Acinetobacter towneri]MCO8058100.1 hypothetical protein [Acinetobacter towneri]MCO8063746.1 hypothetical protein [Acinetobacter towneri]